MRHIFLLIIIFLALISGCTIHERDYIEPIPIPQIDNDTIYVSDWDK